MPLGLEEISNQKKQITEKQKLHKIANGFNNFSRAFFAINGALLLIGGMPGVGIAFLSTAVANHLSLNNRGKIEKNKLEQLTREEDHINKIKKNPLDGSKEMTVKRVKKVNELAERKEQTESKRKISSFASGLSTLFQWGSLAAAVCVPNIGWVAALALGAKYLTGKSKIETAKEDDLLALRLNNLNLDLTLTKAVASQPRKASGVTNETPIVVNNSKTKASNKLDDEMLVEKYIESLDGIGEEEISKQYRK